MKRISRHFVLLALGLPIAAVLVWLTGTQNTGSRIELPVISPQDGNIAVALAQSIPCEDDSCLGLAGAVLRPDTSGAEWNVVQDSGCLYATDGDSGTIWSAPVYLKQGARVNTLTMYANDTNALRNSTAWFTIYHHSGRKADEWEVRSSGNDGMGVYTSQGTSHTIDHANYHYLVRWKPNELGSDMQVCGFLIDFEPPESGAEEGDSELPDDVVGGAPTSFDIPFSCAVLGIPEPEDLPAILPAGTVSDWRDDGIRRLCLYGFPVDERIDLALATMDGNYAAHGAFRMQERSASPQPTLVPPGLLKPFIAATVVAPSKPVKIEGMERIVSIISDLRLEDMPDMAIRPERPAPRPPWVDEETEGLEVVQLEPDPGDGAHAARPEAGTVDGVSVLSVPLWWPVGLPSGVWLVAAVAPGFDDTVALFFEAFDGISTRPEGEADPFVNHHCDTYEPGDTMIIEGAGLEPNSSSLLGLYRWAETGYTLADSLWVSTDDEGSFARDQVIDSSYEDGRYVIVGASEISVSESGVGFFGLPKPCFSVSIP